MMNKADQNQMKEYIKSMDVDERFVGIWSGTDHGKFFKGETNSWMVNRKADGTMTVNFKTIHSDDRVTFSEDEGVWCTIGDEYYEFRDSDVDGRYLYLYFYVKRFDSFYYQRRIERRRTL